MRRDLLQLICKVMPVGISNKSTMVFNVEFLVDGSQVIAQGAFTEAEFMRYGFAWG